MGRETTSRQSNWEGRLLELLHSTPWPETATKLCVCPRLRQDGAEEGGWGGGGKGAGLA